VVSRPSTGPQRAVTLTAQSSPRIVLTAPPADEDFGGDAFVEDRAIGPSMHSSSTEFAVSPARPVAPQKSRMPIVLLGAIVTGCIGAFVIAKIMEHAEVSPSEPALRTFAKAPDPPAPAAPVAEVAPPPSPRAEAATVPAPAASPSNARTEPAIEPPAAAPSSIERVTGAPAAKPRANPARSAKAAARLRPDADVAAEPSSPEPRSEERPAPGVSRPEPSKTAASPPEIPNLKAPAAETSEPGRAVARQDPAASAPRPGAIDIAATRAAVRAQLAPVQQCYERARMDDPSLTGTIVARITIGADGAVTQVEIVKSSLGAPQIESCVRQGISRWRLPRPSGGVPASLTYPLVFE
jgi:TonB family protein